MMTNEVKCPKCGWVHFTMTREEVRAQEKLLDQHGIKRTIPFDKCFRCGEDYKKMIPAQDGDAPRGSTIQPILEPNASN